MHANAQRRHGTIDEREYKKFAGSVANVFSRDWTKVEGQFIACLKFLPEIPDQAWRPMAAMAAEQWESWPRNMVRAIKELYFTWKNEAKIKREVTECDYCNSVGFFSGGRCVEVKPEVKVWYWHTWRCSACANWKGVIGIAIPAGYPLEKKSEGFTIKRFSKMQSDGERKNIAEFVDMAGEQVNDPTDRPPWMNYREPGDDD